MSGSEITVSSQGTPKNSCAIVAPSAQKIGAPTKDTVSGSSIGASGSGPTGWSCGFRRSALMRAYMYEFIELLAPHLPRKLVREAEKAETQADVERGLGTLTVPLRE